MYLPSEWGTIGLKSLPKTQYGQETIVRVIVIVAAPI
jgi:hypothetical protein